MKPVIEGERGSSRLTIGAQEITLPGPIEQVLPWDGKECVVVLLRSPESLLVFDWNGQLKRSFPPPEGFNFYYMMRDSDVGVSVVCVAVGNTRVDGWQDWQFSINLETGELVRFSPSK